MNPNYDMTKLRNGLDKAWKHLAVKSETLLANEVEEALHVLATQAAWIAKARPALYHMWMHLETTDDRLGEETQGFMNAAGKLLDGWLPPSTRQVSFDGENWIDLPFNQSVPQGMQQRVKLKGEK